MVRQSGALSVVEAVSIGQEGSVMGTREALGGTRAAAGWPEGER